jgi:uncharacterized membrane protein YedE/YeeE
MRKSARITLLHGLFTDDLLERLRKISEEDADMAWLTASRLSPYMVGAGIGVLSWFTFLLSKKPIGCSTAFARSSGMIERLFRGDRVLSKPYYEKFAPVIDWEWMLVLGIVFGSLISALLSGDHNLLVVPHRWEQTFGPNVWVRLAAAFAGGVLLGFGARWAGGCTSGHGISGTLQLALSSWVAAICFFLGGIAAAYVLFNLIGG